MIDKVELRVPPSLRYSREFAPLYRELRNDPRGPFRASQHYTRVADLRDFGYSVILHTHCLRDQGGNHKLEMVNTGAMKYSQMLNEVSRIFDVGIEPLAVMRIDLAADVVGVPVAWFEKHIRAQYKRWTCTVGKGAVEAEFAKMGKTGVETLYFGRRPNVFRIYDKIAERGNEYAKLKAKARRGFCSLAELPTFEQFCGYPESGFTLTRVERQIGGGRVPKTLATLRSLRKATEFNPFERLVFLGSGRPEPHPDDYDFTKFCTGMFLRGLIDQQGYHRARQFVNRHTKRNASRVMRQYEEFFPADDLMITPEALFKRYQESVLEQIAA